MNELKLYGEPEVLEEVTELIYSFQELAQEHSIYISLIESLILQSKLQMIRGDIEKAEILLEQALIITEEKGLTQLQKHAQKEKEIMIQQFDEMKQMIANNVSISQRMDKLHLVQYIKKAQQLKE